MNSTVNAKRLDRENVMAVCIDFQEKLMPAMLDRERLEDKVVRLCKGLRALEVPILVSQQYTKGLGATVAPIAKALGKFAPFEKTSFSVLGSHEFEEKIKEDSLKDKKTVLLFGIETHICMLQSAFDFINLGYEVHVVVDCCSSRDMEDKEIGLRRLEAAGALLTTYESVLFQLVGGARAAGFKEISAIVK